MWVAFSCAGHPRLLGQVVEVIGSGREPWDPMEVRVWCSALMDVVPVPPASVLEQIESAEWKVTPVRRASADGS